jgi:hypothetical protein
MKHPRVWLEELTQQFQQKLLRSIETTPFARWFG